MALSDTGRDRVGWIYPDQGKEEVFNYSHASLNDGNTF